MPTLRPRPTRAPTSSSSAGMSALHEATARRGTALPQRRPPIPRAPWASGLQLIGEVPGSGYRREPPALVRRSDGQTIQLTRLLYQVLHAVDGRRSPEEIASVVGPEVDRAVTAENVQTLCDRLRELGALRLADGSEPQLRRSNPLLALRLLRRVGPSVTNRVTAPVRPALRACRRCARLHRLRRGLRLGPRGQGTRVRDPPGLRPAGPAARGLPAHGVLRRVPRVRARRGGPLRRRAARGHGYGLYLVWPAFYTDVTATASAAPAACAPTSAGCTSTPSWRS